jgi:hypothetical protein
MLIKLNTVSFVTVGQGASFKVERTILEPIWLNTNHIITMDLKAGPEQCPDITRIFLTHNHQISVLETPEQIIELIKATQS